MCKRCLWVDGSKPDYVRYHDNEWGRPIFDDRTLFEYLTLESAQAGLSWYTILKKRTHYQHVFHDFSVEKVAIMDKSDVSRLMNDKNRRDY
jgi:DNA-3-methyladenine glycosylase I